MENMMETKDLMWALWSLVLCVVSYKVGHFIGFTKAVLMSRDALLKMVNEGSIKVKGAE